MKHICIVCSLTLLLFVSACDGLSRNKEVKEVQPAENTETEIVSDLSQNYFTMEEGIPTITGEIKNGELWLNFNKEQILPIGIVDEDSYRLPDSPIQVQGLKGAPKNYIIADIGQDYNPILCVLTEEGKVQIASLWNTVATGDLIVTEIPMDNIIDFKDGPGGPWEDEDGTVNYGYTTIYGIDTEGNEHEVPLYTFENNLEYVTNVQGTDVTYQLYFDDDWKMRYAAGYYLSEKAEELHGRFWLISEDWDNMLFRFGYELTSSIEYIEDGFRFSAIERNGVFDLKCSDSGNNIHTITPIEGVDFANMGMNVPVPFHPSGAYGS